MSSFAEKSDYPLKGRDEALVLVRQSTCAGKYIEYCVEQFPYEDICEAAAIHSNTPSDVLAKLSQHDSVTVRAAVALNHRLDDDIVRELLASEDPEILFSLVYRPDLPVDYLKIIGDKNCFKDSYEELHPLLAEHPNADGELLEVLALWHANKSGQYRVMRGIALHRRATKRALKTVIGF